MPCCMASQGCPVRIAVSFSSRLDFSLGQSLLVGVTFHQQISHSFLSKTGMPPKDLQVSLAHSTRTSLIES